LCEKRKGGVERDAGKKGVVKTFDYPFLTRRQKCHDFLGGGLGAKRTKAGVTRGGVSI